MPTIRPILAATLILTGAVPEPQGPARPPRPAPVRTEIAEGVFLFQTAPYGDVGLDGNAIAITSSEGVLVFDANGTPDGAAAVIASLKQVTNQPVRYVVVSHWHWDHWYGLKSYVDAFPHVEIFAQERTQKLMAGPAIAFNQPGLDEQLPGHIKAVEDALAKARAASPPDTNVARLAAHVAFDQWFLEQKREGGHVIPNRTFEDSVTLHVGDRVIQVRTPGHAITPGDAYLWLPKERIAITGDLLINPITFGLFCYPAGWIRALEQLDALDPVMLVPGHGAPMHDKVLLHATTDLLTRERAMAAAAKSAGKSVAEAQAAILADSGVLALRATITGGIAARNDAFALYLVEWFVKRVYQEIDGTLDDSIPKTP